jgi:hypothetical protein
MYALAAGAAGAGVLALAPPAQGKIVYTKKEFPIYGFYVPLSLTNSGTVDFVFRGSGFATTGFVSSNVGVEADYAHPSNGIRQDTKVAGAAALRAGVQVGPKAPFGQELLMGLVGSSTFQKKRSYAGPWENGGKGVKNRYLGLKFHINGRTHYGWARANFPSPAGAVVTGYAYETIPNKPIIAGKTKGPDVITMQPATLGSLALGRK